MSEGLHTAAEIAKMGLPGLPTTKASILARAEKEGWQYETQKGRGGERKLFRIPAQYTPAQRPQSDLAAHDEGGTATALEAKKSPVDRELMSTAVQALDEFMIENNLTLDPERKGAILTFLYNYLLQEGDIEDAADLLRAVGGY